LEKAEEKEGDRESEVIRVSLGERSQRTLLGGADDGTKRPTSRFYLGTEKKIIESTPKRKKLVENEKGE